MIQIILNVVYVLIAVTMVVFILLQRGAGASAGAGFGAGASGTVFGARGSANFLSSSTKWLAGMFFALSLFMAWQASHYAKKSPSGTGLGVMSELPEAQKKPSLPSAPVLPPTSAPALPATQVIAPEATAPAAASSDNSALPAAPAKGGKSN